MADVNKKVYLGADHAGYLFKEHIKGLLDKEKIPYEDLGCDTADSKDDYVDYAKNVAQRVKAGDALGILICGSGTGMAIAANKIRGIRAAFAYDEYSARMARYDNDANILTLRARKFPKRKIKRIIRTWLSTPFSGIDRHKQRIEKLKKLEC
jgi:ribose 5-phosphate isomerase B